MTELLDHLIEALRAELQHYGEILSWLDLQHEAVKLQGAEEVLRIVAAIHAQSAAIQTARTIRQHWQQQVALALGHSPDASLTQLAARMPEPYRLLVLALVRENNELRDRVREQAQHNQLLLGKAVELLERFLHALNGPAVPGPNRPDAPAVLEESLDPTPQHAIA